MLAILKTNSSLTIVVCYIEIVLILCPGIDVIAETTEIEIDATEITTGIEDLGKETLTEIETGIEIATETVIETETEGTDTGMMTGAVQGLTGTEIITTAIGTGELIPIRVIFIVLAIEFIYSQSTLKFDIDILLLTFKRAPVSKILKIPINVFETVVKRYPHNIALADLTFFMC